MRAFWQGKKVFLTGHTGFKGSWLSLWLTSLGARVRGYALEPATNPSLFELARLHSLVDHIVGDVRDPKAVTAAVHDFEPDIVFHMAAQPLVRHSYRFPAETYEVNVMGTVHLLEAVRAVDSVRGVLVITSDKCYAAPPSPKQLDEEDPMGGDDPYSSSKGCAELVVQAYRASYTTASPPFLPPTASVRAGNVIGGGDWCTDRVVTMFIEAMRRDEVLALRNPDAIRPWQHVLEPLYGYMLVAQRLYTDGQTYAEGWNFGPALEESHWTVRELVEQLLKRWGRSDGWTLQTEPQPPELHHLRLNSDKARSRLGWTPALALESTLDWLAEWYQAVERGDDARQLCLNQIQQYEKLQGVSQ